MMKRRRVMRQPGTRRAAIWGRAETAPGDAVRPGGPHTCCPARSHVPQMSTAGPSKGKPRRNNPAPTALRTPTDPGCCRTKGFSVWRGLCPAWIPAKGANECADRTSRDRGPLLPSLLPSLSSSFPPLRLPLYTCVFHVMVLLSRFSPGCAAAPSPAAPGLLPKNPPLTVPLVTGSLRGHECGKHT